MTVWLVGGRKGSPFCDVYSSRESAVAAVLGYLRDEFWLSKMHWIRRRIVELLSEGPEPELAIESYNASVGIDDQWVISEQEVRN